MLNSQVVAVFCTVEAEVLLFFKPTETVGCTVGSCLLKGLCIKQALYKTALFHSSHCYKKVFDLVNASLGGL